MFSVRVPFVDCCCVLSKCVCPHRVPPSVLLLGDRTVLINDTDHKAEVKSHQWFGATVRSHGDTILVS